MYINSDDIGKVFSKRENDTHKGRFGTVLCICGSYAENGAAMCGAAYLCGLASYRCGAGVVRIYTHRENYAPIAANLPEAVYSLYSGTPDLEALASLAKNADCVVVGCGLSQSENAKKMLECALENTASRLVIDADGLNLMANDNSLWGKIHCPTVITPHIGEMARLCGKSIGEIAENCVDIAKSFAKDRGVVCVLKSHKTVVSDGESVYINTTGNPAMAKGGSGDVLAGILGGALAQKHIYEGFDIAYVSACCVYIHGKAGDDAAQKLGEYSVLARDIANNI